MAYVMKSGLIWLVDNVRSYLTSAGVTAKVTCGFQQRHRILTQGPGQANRIVFTPMDDTGAAGRLLNVKIVGDRRVGDVLPVTPLNAKGVVRALQDWERVCLVSVWSRGSSQGLDEDEREEREIEANEDLMEWMIRAVHATALADVKFGKVRMTAPPERNFGIEARIELTFRTPVFDRPADIVRPEKPAITKDLES